MSHRVLQVALLALLLWNQQRAKAQVDAPSSSPKVTIDGRGLEVRSARPLMRIGADGSGLAVLLDRGERLHGSPQWSPDGEWIACDTWVLGQGFSASQIAVMRADGSDVREIGPGAMPSWSPDGKQLVVHTYESPQTIVTMNADGSGREMILRHWGSPRWSPTGNRIVSIAAGRAGLAAFDLNTGVERAMFTGPYSVIQGFSISPDGRRFCFGDYDAGIALATLDEKTMQASVRWLAREGKHTHSSWSPDGKRVVVSWMAPGTKLYQLYVIEVNEVSGPAAKSTPKERETLDEPSPSPSLKGRGNQSEPSPGPSLKGRGIRLLPGQDGARHNVDPDWSPDGKTIVFASQAP